MATSIITNDVEEVEATLSRPTKWLDGELRKRVRTVSPTLEEGTKVTLFAHLETKEKTQSVLKVTTWKASDLYAYSDAPRIELLNVFGRLLDKCDQIGSADDAEDYELKT